MNKENKIILLRFAAMRTKLDVFEDEALVLMLGNFNKAKKELIKELNALALKLPSDSFSIQRAKALLTEVEVSIAVIKERLTGDIIEMGTYSGLFSYPEVNKIASWDGKVEGFDFVSLTAAQLNSAILETPLGGRTLSEWVDRTFANLTTELKSELDTGLIKGESYKKMVSRLTKNFEILERDAITLARSYIQEVNVRAATDIFEANQKYIPKVEWTAIMENGNVKTGRGTCPRCQALDGLQWATNDKDRPYCPLHARCRCMFVPITLTWRELGFDVDEMEDVYQPWVIRAERAINVGGVPIIDYGFTDKNYSEWWNTRSKAFQNNSIGPVRAELVRDGIIEFQDIVDQKTGRLYTIKELLGRQAATN